VTVERALDQPLRIRNIVARVLTDDEAVELVARHARWTGTRLDVEYERAVRHERFFAAVPGAAYSGRLVVFRAQVVSEVGGVREASVAFGTEVVLVAIVFLEFLIVVEHLVTPAAGVMVLLCVVP